ncbi:MAG: murein biosynthesis integral membrane protein MurJ [Proteocatella sp.]
MKKTAVILMVISVLSKITGLGRDLTLSYIYGASNISDAYLISITIPGVIFGFIATGIAAGYIPMYSKILSVDGEYEANLFTNNLINILLVICTIVVALGLIFTDQIVRTFASGFKGETLALTVQFTKITLFAIYFTGTVSIFSGFLQIKDNYIIQALIGLPLNFFLILSIIIGPHTNVVMLATGYVVAIVSQLLLMIPYMRRNKYRYKAVFDLKDKNIRNMAYIVMPLILGVSVNQINVLVDRTIASQLAVGGISALNYANRLNGFVQGIFVLSIATVLYPMMSKMAAEENMIGLKKSLSESITGINLLVLPATMGSMILATPIVSILFGRGAFDNDALHLTSYALFFYSIGMIGFGLRDILSRVFYSIQDTKTPMINAAIGMVLNIILNIILSKYMGIGGLALATSISAIFTTGLLFISLHKKIGSFGLKHIFVSFVKISFASLIMGLLAKTSFDYFSGIIGPSLSLIIAIGVGAISYSVMIYFMKIEDVDVLVNSVKKKLWKSAT